MITLYVILAQTQTNAILNHHHMTAFSRQRATIMSEILHVFVKMDLKEMVEEAEMGVQVSTLSFLFM